MSIHRVSYMKEVKREKYHRHNGKGSSPSLPRGVIIQPSPAPCFQRRCAVAINRNSIGPGPNLIYCSRPRRLRHAKFCRCTHRSPAGIARPHVLRSLARRKCMRRLEAFLAAYHRAAIRALADAGSRHLIRDARSKLSHARMVLSSRRSRSLPLYAPFARWAGMKNRCRPKNREVGHFGSSSSVANL